MKPSVAALLIAGLLLSAVGPLAAASEGAPPTEQQGESLTELLDLLVGKGVLSPEEGEDLKRRAAEPARPDALPEPPKPTYPSVRTRVRVQARWSTVEDDAGQPFFGERDDQAGGDGFAVRRARLQLLGQLNPQVGYHLQYQADNGTEDANLHVAEIQWKGWGFADLVAGQLQTPGGYEIVICDANLCLTDRAAVSVMVPPDKDIGIRIDGKRPLPGGLSYQFFVGNGSGKYKGAGSSDGYLWVGRLSATPTPHLTTAATYSSNNGTDYSSYQARFLKKNGDPYGLLPAYAASAVDETHWGADFQYERHPWTVWGEYAAARIEPEGGQGIRTCGYYLTAASFIPYRGRRDKVQLSASYQAFDANTAVTDQYDMTAWTLGVNYHIAPKFQHMVRAAYAWTNEKANPVDNNKFVLQYQLWF